MPIRRSRYRISSEVFLEKFPESLERFKVASGLSWSEIARRVGTSTLVIRRWRRGAHPSSEHLIALLNLAEDMGLAHLLPIVIRTPHGPRAQRRAVPYPPRLQEVGAGGSSPIAAVLAADRPAES